MNTLLPAILLLLSHAGYWVGGRPQRIDVQWALNDMPDAIVHCELTVAGTTLAKADATLSKEKTTTLTIQAPTVRAPISATLRVWVIGRQDKKPLANVEKTVQLYPNALTDLKALTAGQPPLVIDAENALPSVLKDTGVTFDRRDGLAGLAATANKTIIVGQDKLAANDPAAAALTSLAESGATVIVLRQSAGPRVLQYEVAERDVTGYWIDAAHPLLRHLPAEAWKSLLVGRQPTLALPADEPALELISSPVEAANVESAPLDALLLTRTTGAGRLVYCQLPLDDVRNDARAQQLLLNLIEYAQTRPQPTPPRAVRMAQKKTDRTGTKTNQILGGN